MDMHRALYIQGREGKETGKVKREKRKKSFLFLSFSLSLSLLSLSLSLVSSLIARREGREGCCVIWYDVVERGRERERHSEKKVERERKRARE